MGLENAGKSCEGLNLNIKKWSRDCVILGFEVLKLVVPSCKKEKMNYIEIETVPLIGDFQPISCRAFDRWARSSFEVRTAHLLDLNC